MTLRLKQFCEVRRSSGNYNAQSCVYQGRVITVYHSSQDFRSPALLIRNSLKEARLWRDQGKRDEARDLLAPVYGWFTDGFDTLDLKEAKALLGELAS
jgi:hypothetical protein